MASVIVTGPEQLLLEQLSDKPSLSIPAACGGQAETAAAYRFFANEKTDTPKVLSPHRQATVERVRAEAVVIAAQEERFVRCVAARVLILSGGTLRPARSVRIRVAEPARA